MSMEQVFGDYGRYYDLLYAGKDYAAEAAYVAKLLERFQTSPCSPLPAPCSALLEFGSGTGRHGRLLARRGYQVTGIERSTEMVAAAEARSKEQGARREERGAGSEERGDGSRDAGCGGSFRCVLGDIRHTDVGCAFDAVISLFHVLSYQTEDEDVTAVFENAARHLKADGLFLFDVWYAPAVLTQRPEVRIKRVEDDTVHVTRIAEPTLRADQNCVQVDYTLFVRDKLDGAIRTLSESHRMRYFSTPEIQWIGRQHGLALVAHEEWLTGKPANVDTWGVAYVMKKRGAGSRERGAGSGRRGARSKEQGARSERGGPGLDAGGKLYG